MKVKEESEKVGLKLNIQKTKIMASGPITSWQIDGETVDDFIFLGSKITAFELWCWRRLLRVPWTPRRSNQSILKEISPGCSLEGMMLQLKFQYFGHFMRRVDSLEKTLMLGGIGGRRRRGTSEDEMAGWHQLVSGHEFEWTLGVGDGQGGLACCDSWGHKESDMTEWLNWTELKITADGDYSHEIKRHLLLGRKVMTNLDSILKRRDITLPTKVCLVKAMVFPIVMYGYEIWTIKKVER